MRKQIAALGILVPAIIAGCSTTNHDTTAPATDIQITWWRFDTPPSVVTEYFGCFGTDGILLDQADGNVSVQVNDPMCPVNGADYKIVYAVGSNPKQLVWQGRIPPDDIPANILAPTWQNDD